jgi:hypothetical protein
MAAMTSEPGEPRRRLDRPPGERYGRPNDAGGDGDSRTMAWLPVAIGLGGVLAYTLLGGVLAVTAGLIVVAGFVGWILGKLISPPWRAAVAALATIVVGLLGVWLFGRVEGGVLDPLTYLDEVQGWPLVLVQLVVGAGLAAASSR